MQDLSSIDKCTLIIYKNNNSLAAGKDEPARPSHHRKSGFYMGFVLNFGCFMAYRVALCITSNNFHVPSSAGDIMTHSLN